MANDTACPDLTRFLDKADEVVLGVKRNEDCIDPQVLEYFIKRLKIIDSAIRRIHLTYSTGNGNQAHIGLLEHLNVYQLKVRGICTKLKEKRAALLQGNHKRGSYHVPAEESGGRPRFLVTQGQIERLRTLNFSWKRIAAMLGISRITLWRRRKDLGIDEDYSTVSDSDLDEMVSSYRDAHPFTGERELIGFLRSAGMKIQRQRVRESINRCDPINTALRWHEPIKRRPYSVPSPNSLWHIDSCLKLIRWGFVVQGGVDGYSRVVVYIKCSLNNKASTTLDLFTQAVQKHGLPSRVRCDYGGENQLVGNYMLKERGLNRGSLLTGPSTHNSRIERLWRESNKSVLRLYSRIFSYLENRDKSLHVTNPIHLYSLQYVFLPRINQALQEWLLSWNCHPLSTAQNLTPLQIREAAFLERFGSSRDVVRDVFDPPLPPACLEEFGIDCDEEPADEHVESLEVPRVNLPMGSDVAQRLLGQIEPLSNDKNYGIDLYKQCVAILTRNTQ